MPFDSADFLKPKKAGDVTVRELVGWLETKRPSERYFYTNSSHCLWAQYLKEHGAAKYVIGALDMPGGLWGWGHKVAIGRPNTFGAALGRARRYLPWRERLPRFMRKLFQAG